jgi:hypothetical protein
MAHVDILQGIYLQGGGGGEKVFDVSFQLWSSEEEAQYYIRIQVIFGHQLSSLNVSDEFTHINNGIFAC